MLTEAKGCNLVKFCRPSSAVPARERPQECGRSGAGAVWLEKASGILI